MSKQSIKSCTKTSNNQAFLTHPRMLQGWFYIRWTQATTCTTIVSNFAMSLIKKSEVLSRTYKASLVDMYTINVEVRYLGEKVDLHHVCALAWSTNTCKSLVHMQ